MLAAADTWLLPQPKAVALTGESFDLKKCKGIRLVGCDEPWLQDRLPGAAAGTLRHSTQGGCGQA